MIFFTVAKSIMKNDFKTILRVIADCLNLVLKCQRILFFSNATCSSYKDGSWKMHVVNYIFEKKLYAN